MHAPEPVMDVAHVGHLELLAPKPKESLRFLVDVLGMTGSGRRGDSVSFQGWDDYERYSRAPLAPQQPEPARYLLIVVRLGGKPDLARAADVAGDVLFPRDPLHRVDRVVDGAVDAAGVVAPQAVRQRREDVGRSVVHMATVPVGCLPDNLASLQHRPARAAPRQRGEQPGAAAADHGQVHGALHRPGFRPLEGCGRAEPARRCLHDHIIPGFWMRDPSTRRS